MAKIKHIAIATPEPEKTAQFYQAVFGLQVAARADVADTEAVFLTDGDINVALLRFKTDETALHPEGMRFIGLHHIGFLVQDQAEYDEAVRKLRELGAPFLQGGPAKSEATYFEVKAKDPNGITFDISIHGWAGISR